LYVEKDEVEKTYVPKASDITTAWYLVDAREQSLGRLATKIASVLLGKNEPSFTPGVNLGNHVVVINAEQITVTGKKMEEKMYYRHSQYPGGLKSISLRKQLETHPDRVLKSAVWGMLPHNKLGKRIIKNLKVYAGSDHPHQAQQPKVMA